MNKMLFQNYLKEYLFYVSGAKSLSIHFLFKKSKHNTRILDPLILYCAIKNKEKVLYKYDKEYAKIIEQLKKTDFDYKQFKQFSFDKIYNSYLHKVNSKKYEHSIKEKMRDNILDLQKQKKVSNYRIYRDLKLNPGNINAYLKNNDTSKLSLSTAKKIVNFLYTY